MRCPALLIQKVESYAADMLITRAEAARQLLQAGLAALPEGFAAACGTCGGRGRVVIGKSGPHAAHFECRCGAHSWLSKRELQKLETSRSTPPPAS